ncbi:hypothetical protein [Ligilactobacillus apodemi]|nr:hypothetical protein [Ligilactobacillus apodemi]MCR1900676.1 hypothetical protein [Ligilactobacillus apodemi]
METNNATWLLAVIAFPLVCNYLYFIETLSSAHLVATYPMIFDN